MSGEGDAPWEWPIARLCKVYGALPFTGGILEQPLGLMLIGADLLDYAEAFALWDELDDERVPQAVKKLVAETQAASALERMRAAPR